MFGKKKKHALQGGVQKGKEVFSVHTMEDDRSGVSEMSLAEGASGKNTVEQGGQQQVSTKSPFLQSRSVEDVADKVNAQNDGGTRRNVTVAPPNQGDRHKSQGGQEKASKERGNRGVLVVVALVAFSCVIIVALWLVWRAGFLGTVMQQFSAKTQSSVNMAPSATDIAVSSDVLQEAASEERSSDTVTIRDPYNHGASFAMADVALRITEQAIMEDIINSIESLISVQDGTGVIVDVLTEDAEPMPFNIFVKRFLPNMSMAMITTLDQPFQFFILPKDDGWRINIYTRTESPDETRSDVRNAETTLANGLSPLFLFSPVDVENIVFGDSEYRGVPIRFFNFVPDASQSMDYAMHYNHVFFGTSRSTLRTMMDKVFAYDDAVQYEEDVQVVSDADATISVDDVFDGGGDSVSSLIDEGVVSDPLVQESAI